jgi:cell division protein FtsI (penicillin-binding protein 3)
LQSSPSKPNAIFAQVVPASQIARLDQHPQIPSVTAASSGPSNSAGPPVAPTEDSTAQKSGGGGTVVIDVEERGIEVPSFLGKNLRTAMEAAQDAGLDLDAIGSGVAREQTPQAGAHVAAGSRVTVRFGR